MNKTLYLIIIKIFYVIGGLGVLFAQEMWQRALYLILFAMFYQMDVKLFYFPKKKEEGK